MFIRVDSNNIVTTDAFDDILGEDSIYVENIPRKIEIEGKICYQIYNPVTGKVENAYEDILLPPVPPAPSPTMEEMQMQTLLNTEYLVIISEITNV
jgi:hypothetical protein